MKATATNHPISWFKREADSGALDLSPSFQRRPIWDDQQASYLIDSILNDYPIPEVYIRAESTIDGTTVHQVIDGQQRIRSILQFVENDLSLDAEDLTPGWKNLTFEQLDDATKKLFWDYQLVVRELGQASDADIKDLFRRVNLNSVDLNDQELRHARYEGHFIGMVEDLADDPWWVENGLFTVREIRRMLDVEFISELVVGLIAGPQNKKVTLDDYYDDYETTFADEGYWRREFKRTRELLEDVTGEELPKWRGKSEFYSLFVVLGDLLYQGTKFSTAHTTSIANALSRFRTEVDQAKKRANTEVFDDEVHQYAEAVSRAATDLSRRTTRDDILRSLILDAM